MTMRVCRFITVARGKIDTDEPNQKIQNDRLGRGQFFSRTAVRGDADEVLDGDAEGRDYCGGDSRNLVFGLCGPIGSAPVQAPVG